MLEVISSLANDEGESIDTAIEVAKQKTLKRGSFKEKYI